MTIVAEQTITFTRGVPPSEALPAAKIAECMSAVLANDGPNVLQYGHHAGYKPLRSMLAADYGVDESSVLVGNGSLHLQDLLAATVIKPGDVVLVEQPSYDRSITTFERRGAKVRGITLENDGVNIEQLEQTVKQQKPAFMYLVPDFQNPAGLTMSRAKREAIVALADEYDFWLVEDVPYRTLRYTGEDLPLLRDLNPRRVITMSSYSKLISPALRVGYMIAPPELVADVTALATDTILCPVLPTQAAVAEFRRRGWLEQNVAELKQLYYPRLQAMAEAVRKYLPSVNLTEPEGGFFLSIYLPAEADTTDLLNRAKAAGLVLTDGRAFFAEPADQADKELISPAHFVRLPFCAVTPDQIDEGVRRLASLL